MLRMKTEGCVWVCETCARISSGDPHKLSSTSQVSRSIIFLLSGSISLYGRTQQPSLEVYDDDGVESKPKDLDKHQLFVTLLPGMFVCV